MSSTDACVRRRRHEIVCFGLKWHMATLIRWSDGSISDLIATVTSLAELYWVYELGYAASTRQHKQKSMWTTQSTWSHLQITRYALFRACDAVRTHRCCSRHLPGVRSLN